MSNNMIPQYQWESFGGDKSFALFDDFDIDTLFDFNNASCDSTLPSVEPNDEFPTTTVNIISLDGTEQPDGLQNDFFDSASASDDTFGSLHSDMSFWPAEISTEQPRGVQGGDWPSPTTFQVPDILPAGPTTSASPAAQNIEVLPATSPGQPIGPIEALWRPVMGFSPPTKARPRASIKSRAPKVAKKKKTAAHKCALSTIESRDRSTQELYNATWGTLSQEEKGRLLFPLLQGINPNPGDLEAMHTALVNQDSPDDDFTNSLVAAMQAFNKSCDATVDPTSSGTVGGPAQMPAPPSIYGCTRQQEALERNAMLRAQGRRR